MSTLGGAKVDHAAATSVQVPHPGSAKALLAALPLDARRIIPPAVLAPPAGVCSRGTHGAEALQERLCWGGLTREEAAHDALNVRHLTDDGAGASSVLVGSWNIRNLSCRRSTLRLGVAARVLSQFDVRQCGACRRCTCLDPSLTAGTAAPVQVVAVQEARDARIVFRLLSQLNACSRWPVWRCVVSSPVRILDTATPSGEGGGPGVRGSSHWEHYAFFWQEHRVRLVGKPAFASREHHEWVLHVSCRVQVCLMQLAAAVVLMCGCRCLLVWCRMAREPYFAYFRCRVGDAAAAASSSARAFDFVLVNVHIIFAKGDRAARRREVRHLQSLIDTLRERIKHEDDLILVGGASMPWLLAT